MIKAEAKDYDPKKHGETFPNGTVITYTFIKRGTRGPLKLIWHDGVESLPRPPEMEPDRKLPEAGAIVLGTKGASCTARTAQAACGYSPRRK